MEKSETDSTQATAHVSERKVDLVRQVKQCLDRLADLEAEKAKVVVPFNAQIVTLEAERNAATFGLDDEIGGATRLVRELVLTLKESVKGTQRHAVYFKGRVTWDSTLLKGYAIANPEVLQMRKVGKPSVSIRKVK